MQRLAKIMKIAQVVILCGGSPYWHTTWQNDGPGSVNFSGHAEIMMVCTILRISGHRSDGSFSCNAPAPREAHLRQKRAKDERRRRVRHSLFARGGSWRCASLRSSVSPDLHHPTQAASKGASDQEATRQHNNTSTHQHRDHVTRHA